MDSQTSFLYPSPSVSGKVTAHQRESLKRYGVEFDENGQPLWYTVPEWFDALDRKLIDHFGDEYRDLANKRRSRWNSRGKWRFQKM